MAISVDTIIYAYVFACVVLMLFNIIYILRTRAQKRNQPKLIAAWRKEVLKQIWLIRKDNEIAPNHLRILTRRLNNLNMLRLYGRALERINTERPKIVRVYLRTISPALQSLALKYQSKDSMARAFFADIIHRFPPFDNNEAYHPLMDILTSYLDNSSVYCRENVLNALYVLGNVQAVENALEILNDRELFHHQKLISDGLTTFAGDKAALAARLWSKHKKWNDYLMLAVVQFITNCLPGYREVFFPVLKDNSTDIEIRLAIMRYYRKYTYEPVRPLLLEFLDSGKYDNSMAIVAASVLEKYKGENTVLALKRALTHHNWYVRNNAAAALVNLKIPKAQMNDILYGNDTYAKEILKYMIERKETIV